MLSVNIVAAAAVREARVKTFSKHQFSLLAEIDRNVRFMKFRLAYVGQLIISVALFVGLCPAAPLSPNFTYR